MEIWSKRGFYRGNFWSGFWIKKFGAVSEECCLSMVKNLTKISKSQINVSVTGIAGPKGGSKSKPVGLVYIRINYKGKNNIYKYLFRNKTRRSIQKVPF